MRALFVNSVSNVNAMNSPTQTALCAVRTASMMILILLAIHNDGRGDSSDATA